MLRIRTIHEKWVRIRSDFRLNKTNVYSVQLGKEFCFESTMCVFNNWSLPPSYSMEWPFLASKEPKIQRKWPKFDTRFCFGHNIWSDAYFSIPFSLVIYIYPARCMETNIDHILWPFQTKPEWLFWVILAVFNNLAMIAWLDMALNMVHVGFLCI